LTQAFFHPDLMANIEQKVPAWSPDGSTIAYWQGVEGNDPRPGLPREVWLMQAQGTGHRGLTQGDDPVWSPDGAFVIHSNIFGAQPALAAIRPDGSDAHILFPVNVCRPLQSSVKVAR